MKILHFSSAISWRGGEQQITYLQEVLANKGVQQWIYCPIGSGLTQYCQQKNIPYFSYQKRFSTNPLVAVQLKKLCLELNIDLVHLHDSHSHTFGFMSALLGNQTPFVLSRRVDFRVQNNWMSYKKYNHSSIMKIISVSQYVQNILAPAIEDKRKLVVVHSGIDRDRFQFKNQSVLRSEFNIPKDYKIIANVAAIAPHKDYFTFVDTAEILLQKKHKLKFFIIGGDGGEQALIEAYIAKKRLADSIILTGFRKDIPSILSEIDVFLFTSKEEGLGTSILDAMACGIPIVATAAGGIPELIQNEENGLLAPIQNPQKLADLVERLLTGEKIREQFEHKGREVVKQFSKEVMGEKTLSIYQQILVK